MSWLINPAQLDKLRRSQKNILVFDASLNIPTAARPTKAEFIEKHIAGAHFLDIAAFSDPTADLPSLLPRDTETISQLLSTAGIRSDCKLVFYDNSDCHSACRAVWMMKCVGHNPHQLYVVDGGLSAWDKYIGKTESGITAPKTKSYPVKWQLQHIRNLAQIKENLRHPHEQIIDVRHPVRFAGGKESRANLRSGHIPGSFSFPYSAFFDSNTRNFLSLEKIRALLMGIGVDLQMPIIATCGSGMTAAILDFVLDLLGHKQHAVYSGSWSEWGYDKLYPGEQSLCERPVVTSVEEET